ncbi:MAG TPA: YfbK domain-containing protein, partial [Lacunisphaera sp.]|nr:YfbK domain-containing protein [Lacunisphaera sp.]
PALVAAYRLIGYENRLLAKEDFNNDAVDAGEIGAGHTVTALYEVVPAGTETATPVPAVDALKYQRVASPSDRGEGARAPGLADEMLTVKIRYKEPAGEVSSKLEFALRDAGTGFEQASDDFKFAAAVAGFGMALRDSPHKGSLTLAEVSTWGRSGLGSDASGYRSEFLGLIQQAEKLTQ